MSIPDAMLSGIAAPAKEVETRTSGTNPSIGLVGKLSIESARPSIAPTNSGENQNNFPSNSTTRQKPQVAPIEGTVRDIPIQPRNDNTHARQGPAELRIVYPPISHDGSDLPRVDIIAIHDVGETLDDAWVHRKTIYIQEKLKHIFDDTGSPRPAVPRKSRNTAIETWMESVSVGGAESKPEHLKRDVDDVGDQAPKVNGPTSARQQPTHGSERRVNWLCHSHMLPKEIQGARVMCYTYKTDSVPSPVDFLDTTAADLLNRIVQSRSFRDFDTVPIILIGHGFGALIAQRAIILDLQDTSHQDATPDAVLGMTAGVFLLDAPSPAPGTSLYPQSRSQHTKTIWTEEWLITNDAMRTARGKIKVALLWRSFASLTMRHKTCVVWSYSRDSGNVVCDLRGEYFQHILLTYRHLDRQTQHEGSHAVREQVQDSPAPQSLRRT
jgi:hypothetical protein